MAQRKGPIVVGIDFSDGAARALRVAERLGRETGAEVLPVHVGDSARWEMCAENTRWLQEARLDPERVMLRFGAAWAQIVRCALEEDASYIAVGSHGLSGFQPLAPGSTTARLLTHSPVPVLVGTASRPRAAST
jgi:nucleotide-binding universal stress UspA family protein